MDHKIKSQFEKIEEKRFYQVSQIETLQKNQVFPNSFLYLYLCFTLFLFLVICMMYVVK